MLHLPDAVAHHAVRVLRLRHGAHMTLFNGQGGEYPATLHIQGKTISAQTGDYHAREAEPRLRITLVQALVASGSMDEIVEKAVECGVHTLVPVIARRSPPQPEGVRLQKRLHHWERIVQAASAQCGRNRLMSVASPLPFPAVLRTLTDPGNGEARLPSMLCHPEGRQTLPQALTPGTQAITLFVGAEGGWTDTELQQAQAQGVDCVRFGARILRAPTASVALIAAVQAVLKDC